MTTQETYTAKQAELAKQLKAIQAGLKAHAKEFNKDSWNWGFVGDLDIIKNSLADAEQFLIDSGIDI